MTKQKRKYWEDLIAEHGVTYASRYLSVMLAEQMQDEHEKSMRKDEKYIIQSPKFLNAVKDARKRLGFTNKTLVNVNNKDDWAVAQMSKTSKIPDKKANPKAFYDFERKQFYKWQNEIKKKPVKRLGYRKIGKVICESF